MQKTVKQLYRSRSNKNTKQRLLSAALFLLVFVGLTDAAYLSVEHFRGVIPECSIINGCEQVLTSSYSTIGPVPLAVLGAFYYAIMFFALIYYFDSRNKKALKFIAISSFWGLLVSITLVIIQIIAIGAFCFYCLLSATATTGIFLLSVTLVQKDISHLFKSILRR